MYDGINNSNVTCIIIASLEFQIILIFWHVLKWFPAVSIDIGMLIVMLMLWVSYPAPLVILSYYSQALPVNHLAYNQARLLSHQTIAPKIYHKILCF